MCGRFTLRTTMPVLVEHFGLGQMPTLPPRYNIAPSQDVAVVRPCPQPPGRALSTMRWGLIPAWAREPASGPRLINARSETAARKPSFRAAFRHRRCLIPADGFYEWQKRAGGKQPYHIRLLDQQPMAFAGLWETWRPHDDVATRPVETCTILTTRANSLMQPIHDRMPVILTPEDYAAWLDPESHDPDLLGQLLVPFPDDRLQAVAVSGHVNRPGNDDPACLDAEIRTND